MRATFIAFGTGLLVFGLAAAYSKLVANSRYLAKSAEIIQDWARAQPDFTQENFAHLAGAALKRARLYEEEIARKHLVSGMLVNRTTTGRMLDQCDSLLFSSLRFVALKKLGLTDAADAAWNAVQTSQSEGHWLRHPLCLKFTSRDMILGLLAALTQRPENSVEHLTALMSHIDENDGYFSDGPIYVSYTTPGIARLITLLANDARLSYGVRPDVVRAGYSTTELTLASLDPGYQAHLAALGVWIELELQDRARAQGVLRTKPPNFLTRLTALFSGASVEEQRLEYLTDGLVRLDRKNLFFRYLRLRATSALTPSVALGLLQELLAMPGFPEDRLPLNCDRRADYLWQRASWEHRPSFACSRVYHGGDFLWMASLLIEAASSHPRLVSE